MKPIDFSLQTFEDLKARLNENRLAVHRAWLAHGPGTTRDVAAKANIDLLSFRPRSTELYQMGLLTLVDSVDLVIPDYSGMDATIVTIPAGSHEGLYVARTIAEWENFVAAKRLPATGQLALAIKTAIVLFIACLSFSASAMDRWSALSQIESGDNDRAHGRFGEVSRYQIRRLEWRRATAQPLSAATHRAIALAVAQGIQGERIGQFEVNHRRAPSAVEFYLLWNQPANVDHPTPAGLEEARRFENLVNKK